MRSAARPPEALVLMSCVTVGKCLGLSELQCLVCQTGKPQDLPHNAATGQTIRTSQSSRAGSPERMVALVFARDAFLPALGVINSC